MLVYAGFSSKVVRLQKSVFNHCQLYVNSEAFSKQRQKLQNLSFTEPSTSDKMMRAGQQTCKGRQLESFPKVSPSVAQLFRLWPITTLDSQHAVKAYTVLGFVAVVATSVNYAAHYSYILSV